MKYLSSINRTQFGRNWIRSLGYISVSLFLMRPTILNYKITHKWKFWTHEKKFRTCKTPPKNKIGPTKYSWGKILDPRNTNYKKILDPWNTQEKIFLTDKVPTRKHFGLIKYPRRKIRDLQNTHEKKNWDPRRHDDTRLTRSTMARDPQNLAHSRSWNQNFLILSSSYFKV